MDLRELIKEVQEYLEAVLGEEKLSSGAEAGRLRLLARLATSHSPPPAYYLTMNKTDTLTKSPDKVWTEGSYEVMEGPPPVYSNTMPDVLSSSKRISRTDIISTASSQGLGKSTDGLSRRSVVTVQSGVLWRKKRRRPSFLPWCRITEYWAALAQSTLHLYPAERRSKPALQIDLSGYSARPSIIPLKPSQYAFEIYSPGKKTYQFFASSEEEVAGWIKAVCEGCSEDRVLPKPPDGLTCSNDGSLSSTQLNSEGPYEHYDVPDSRLRPVQSHYHTISYSHSPSQEHVYKNVDELSCADNTYYNIVTSGREVRSEQIYQTISENKRELSPSPMTTCSVSPIIHDSPETSGSESPMTTREPSPVTTTNEKQMEGRTDEIDSMTMNKRGSQRMSGGRVQQIVKSLEGHDIKDFEPVEVGRIDLHRLSR